MNRNLVDRFISSLGILSDEDAAELAKILRDPKGARLIANTLDSLHELRSYPSKIKSKDRPQALQLRSIEDLENELSSALFNKRIFKSSKNLVDALNNYFHLDIPDPRKSKESRSRIIERTLKTLSIIPIGEREVQIEKFLDLVIEAGPEYDILFKILASRE